MGGHLCCFLYSNCQVLNIAAHIFQSPNPHIVLEKISEQGISVQEGKHIFKEFDPLKLTALREFQSSTQSTRYYLLSQKVLRRNFEKKKRNHDYYAMWNRECRNVGGWEREKSFSKYYPTALTSQLSFLKKDRQFLDALSQLCFITSIDLCSK